MHGLGHAPPGRIRFVESAWRAAILQRLFSGAPSQLPLVVVKRKHAATRWSARRPFIVIREADCGAARVARDIAAARGCGDGRRPLRVFGSVRLAFQKVGHNPVGKFLRAGGGSVEMHFGRLRRIVGGIEPGEVLDQAGARLRVKALRVALHA